MTKSPEISKNVKQSTEAMCAGKKKEMRPFCLEDGNLSREMDEKAHNDVTVSWKGKGMLRCYPSQHRRNLFTVQKDLGWMLGKTL